MHLYCFDLSNEEDQLKQTDIYEHDINNENGYLKEGCVVVTMLPNEQRIKVFSDNLDLLKAWKLGEEFMFCLLGNGWDKMLSAFGEYVEEINANPES